MAAPRVRGPGTRAFFIDGVYKGSEQFSNPKTGANGAQFTVSVCGSEIPGRPKWCSTAGAVQSASLTSRPVCAPDCIGSPGSTMLSPPSSRKNVWSPNMLASRGTIGWLAGIGCEN